MYGNGSILRMLRRLSPIIAFAAVVVIAGCTQQEPAVPYNESMTVVAVGDSIMVGASEYLTDLVDGIVIDAEVGRPFADGIAALQRQGAAINPPDILVVALGTNAGTNAARIDELVDAAGDVGELIFVNIRVPRDWEKPTNTALTDAAGRYDHVRIVDWYGESANGDHLFRADGYHPNETGSERWANLIVVEVKS
jgi:lysophospholipase L1-like esterase